MQNNIFIPILDKSGQKHYVNPNHIIDLHDIIPTADTPSYCQVYLTHGKSFTTDELAISIIEKILLFNDQAKNTTNNSK
jgi:hypothetical protein